MYLQDIHTHHLHTVHADTLDKTAKHAKAALWSLQLRARARFCTSRVRERTTSFHTQRSSPGSVDTQFAALSLPHWPQGHSRTSNIPKQSHTAHVQAKPSHPTPALISSRGNPRQKSSTRINMYSVDNTATLSPTGTALNNTALHQSAQLSHITSCRNQLCCSQQNTVEHFKPTPSPTTRTDVERLPIMVAQLHSALEGSTWRQLPHQHLAQPQQASTAGTRRHNSGVQQPVGRPQHMARPCPPRLLLPHHTHCH